jgi:aminopeptidase
MTDPRIDKLANLLINYSCGLKAGKILIEAIDVPTPSPKLPSAPPLRAGGHPLVLLKSNEVLLAHDRRARMPSGT